MQDHWIIYKYHITHRFKTLSLLYQLLIYYGLDMTICSWIVFDSEGLAYYSPGYSATKYLTNFIVNTSPHVLGDLDCRRMTRVQKTHRLLFHFFQWQFLCIYRPLIIIAHPLSTILQEMQSLPCMASGTKQSAIIFYPLQPWWPWNLWVNLTVIYPITIGLLEQGSFYLLWVDEHMPVIYTRSQRNFV